MEGKMNRTTMTRLPVVKKISICFIFFLSVIMIAAFLMRPVYAKSEKGGSVNFEEKVMIMGTGNGYVVIAAKNFYLAKNITVKDKNGKKTSLAKIKMPVKAFVQYSLRVDDNVPILKSIDLLE